MEGGGRRAEALGSYKTLLCPILSLKGFHSSSVEFQASESSSHSPVRQGRGCGVIPGEGLASGEGAE